MEVWKDVVGYEKLYEVSNYGGAWRNAARLDIAAYLKSELKAQIKENRILIIG